jgi:hypothetical protein
MVAPNPGTSDGIAKSDWTRVEALAQEIAELAEDEDTSRRDAIRRLFGVLDELEQKYGSKPSLMATRADYLDEDGRATLLEKAFALASSIGDGANRTFISSSLAEFYADDLKDLERAKYWVDRLGESLKNHFDEQENATFARLSRALR